MRLKLIAVALLALGIGQTAAWGGGGPRAALDGPTNAASDQTAVKRAVAEEALRAGFPPSLALAVADAASGFDAGRQGSRGARGVMQLYPETVARLGGPGPEQLWDPQVNARYGIDYLERLIRTHGGRMEPALAQFEQGRLPSEAGTGEATSSSAFVHKVKRLRRRYKAEAQFWVNALKGEPIAWELLRPNEARLRRLGELARHLDHPNQPRERLQSVRQPGSEIERRRRAVLPFLDDFSS